MGYVAALIIIALFSYMLFNLVIEPVYAYFFRKPVYVHFYPVPNKLTLNQLQILNNEFEFYQKLSPRFKRYFEHRVASFIQKYPFHGKEDLVVTDKMKVLISATAVMLTFGMRRYWFTVIDKIVVYPDIYFSNLTEEYHKGEFNPRMKTIVFSWKHFLEGYEISRDNLNLGLHEFGHVLHYEGLVNTDTSASIFSVTYDEIMKQVKHPPNYKKLIESDYFRIYAYTNDFEFIAVILEHFFETPERFQSEFPQLFDKVKTMINFKSY